MSSPEKPDHNTRSLRKARYIFSHHRLAGVRIKNME